MKDKDDDKPDVKTDMMRKLGLVSNNPPKTAVVPVEQDDIGESRCFGFLRGIRDRAISLEFQRIRENDVVGFPYSWLGATSYHPSLGIRLVFASGELFGVRIRGRNLNVLLEEGVSLYDRGILRHRITFIREMSSAESEAAGKNECVVERIEIVPIAAHETMRFLSIGD